MKSKSYNNQQGSTKTSAIIALAVVGLLGYALFNLIPAAYQITNFKSDMRNAMLQSMALPVGNDTLSAKIKTRIKRAASENGVPANIAIEVAEVGKDVKSHAKFTRPIDILPFGIYKYNYEFDETIIETR